MYPELEKYNQIKQQYEKQLSRLKLDQNDLEEEKETMLNQYEELLSKVSAQQKAHSPDRESLTGLRSEIQQLTEELGDVMEESSHLSRAQKERLNEWMSPLEKGLEREVLAAKQHLKLKKEEFQQYRSEMLLLLQQVYEIEEYIHEIHHSYSEACAEYLSKQDKQKLQLQAIDVRQDAKQMLEELQEDLDYVSENGKMPEWFKRKVK
ncbi:hypothetical protein [Pseudalkalibacillus berkeleyi]|uniref:Uncharacterized protein n=1 Tax=Pseudalkalibacillus berkeleyi TaxID=1069813 RepID=A0ABS9GXQ6_9BACL|nr:hypothetical protein [Pseudalkalibacillus berkeleyi]MCF6136268.1 hypothetical protein [Pseudalkalibacillus berkeleyi]